MPFLLAGISSLTFGVADFAGGMAAKKTSAVTVVVGSHLAGLALVLALAPGFGSGTPLLQELAWGAAAGAAGSVGLAMLYHALAVTRMSIVAPVAALVGMAAPVVFGVAAGERPAALAWLGVAVAFPAVVLIARTRDRGSPGSNALRAAWLGIVVGLMFGLFGILISRTGDDSGLWPLLAARVASIVMMSGFAAATRRRLLPGRGVRRLVVSAGLLDMTANILFLLAVREELLSLVAVIMSVYPAATVGLARVVLGEKVEPLQGVGMALALAGVTLIALS